MMNWRSRGPAVTAALAVIGLFALWVAILLMLLGLVLFWVFLAAAALVLYVQVRLRYSMRKIQANPAQASLHSTTAATDVEITIAEMVEVTQSAYRLFRSAGTAEALALYAEMLVNPELHRGRTVERIELQSRVTTRTVTTTYTLPGDSLGPFYEDLFGPHHTGFCLIPVMVPSKGKIFDRESITDEAGSRVDPLPLIQSLEYNLALVTHLMVLTYRLGGPPNDWDESYHLHLADLLSWAARSKQRTMPEDKIATIMGNFARKHDHDSDSFARLSSVVQLLAARYVVLARLTPRRDLTLSYSHGLRTSELFREIPETENLRITRWVQSKLRVPSGFVKVVMRQATLCQSYHLHVIAPRGTYYGPRLLTASSPAILDWATPKLLIQQIPYMRPPVEIGADLHVYGRGLRELREPTSPDSQENNGRLGKTVVAELEVRLRERPVGTELYSAASCVAIALFAFLLRNSYLKDLDNDLLAAALAFPVALVTVASIYGAAASRSFTLSTGGVVGGIVALAEITVLVMGYGILGAVKPDSTQAGDWTPGVFFWNIVVASCITIAVFAVGAFGLRAKHFRRLTEPKISIQ